MVHDASRDEGVWAPARRQLTIGLALAVTVVALKAMAVATILPIVAHHLGDLRLYGWVFSAFMLSGLLGIVVAGTLSDRGPLVRPMLAALALFAAGLLVGGTAPDMAVLVAGRALQGLGAGAVPAIAYVAIARGYPEHARPKMFAVLSTAWVVPSLIGPATAAVVAVQVGWRWDFLGLIPVVVAAGTAAALAFRSIPPPRQVRHRSVPYLPVLGAIAGAALMLGTATTGQIALAAPGVTCGAVVLVTSLRRVTPPGTLTATEAGVAFFVSTLTWTAGSWTQARVVRRLGPRRLVWAGTCAMPAGVGMMGAALLPSLPAWLGVVAWGIAGGGMGLAYSPLSLATLDKARPGETGRATFGLQVSDTLGEALGTGGAGAIVGTAAALLGSGTAVPLAFSLAAGIGLVALFTTRRLPAHLGVVPAPNICASTRDEADVAKLRP